MKSLEIRRLENESKKTEKQIKMLGSSFAEIVTERSKLLTENKELSQIVQIRDKKIESFEEKMKVTKKRKSVLRSAVVESSASSKRARTKNDDFCWICHRNLYANETSISFDPREYSLVCCDLCPRVYHPACIPDVRIPGKGKFACPECTEVQEAENPSTKSLSLKNVTNESE